MEFESTIVAGGQIALPPEVVSEIPADEQLRVVVMWESQDLNIEWRAAGRQRFDAAYSPEDTVYEQLIGRREMRRVPATVTLGSDRRASAIAD